MICPFMVNISLLLGAIISWGVMWPLIEARKGDWYSASLSATSLHGIQGYRVPLSPLSHPLHFLLIEVNDVM